jgi:hypothetical protein
MRRRGIITVVVGGKTGYESSVMKEITKHLEDSGIARKVNGQSKARRQSAKARQRLRN